MAEPDDVASRYGTGTGILDPILAFSPNLSLEEIKRRRAIAGALAARSRPYPKTVGEGMTYFGEALAEAIGDYTTGRAEKKYNTERDAADPTAKFLPGAVAPRPVTEAPPAVVPPPAAAAAPMPAAGRPSSASAYRAGSLAAVDPLTVEPASGPANRDVIAQGILARNNAAPPAPAPAPSPTLGAAPAGPAPDGAGFAEEGGPNPPIVSRDIKPMQMAQAAPVSGLRPPNPDALRTVTPPHPVMGPPTEEEVAAAAYMRQKPGDEVVAARAAALAKIGRDRRENAYREAQEKWKLDYGSGLKREEEEQKYERDYPVKSFEFNEAQKKAALEARLGGRKVEDFVKDFRLEHAEANKQIGALTGIKEAEAAIKAGAITGMGRNLRVDLERAKALWGDADADKIAAQSQVLASTLQSTLAVALAKYQAGDSRVTEGDMKAAQGMIGTPDMQRAAILKLTAIAKEEAHDRINAFEERRHKRVGGTPLEDDFQLTMRPTATEKSIQRLIADKNDPDAIAEFDAMFGPGAARLEISRARRAAERK